MMMERTLGFLPKTTALCIVGAFMLLNSNYMRSNMATNNIMDLILLNFVYISWLMLGLGVGILLLVFALDLTEIPRGEKE